jgi:hypothetical protein
LSLRGALLKLPFERRNALRQYVSDDGEQFFPLDLIVKDARLPLMTTVSSYKKARTRRL